LFDRVTFDAGPPARSPRLRSSHPIPDESVARINGRGQLIRGDQSSASVQAMRNPETESFAMMLSGLGAIGFVAARRRRQG
jgi:hypothetical protein